MILYHMQCHNGINSCKFNSGIWCSVPVTVPPSTGSVTSEFCDKLSKNNN